MGGYHVQKNNVGAIIISAVLLALTVCGSVWDYEIANSIYIGQRPEENFFGILFSFIGVLPTFAGWSFLGASILCLSKKSVSDTAKRRWLTVLAIFLFILSFFYYCNTLMIVNKHVFFVHWAIAYSIGTAVIAAAACLGYKLSQRSTNPKLLKTVMLLTVVSLVVMVVIMSTKEIMNRPRFRFVLESSNPSYFRNWWQSGRDIKSSLAIDGVTDEFSSFPSGHSAYSMFAVFLFPAFADYIQKLNKYKVLLFLCGFAWWGLTSISRLTVGAHYLTDVCIAGFVTIASYGAVVLIKYLIRKRQYKSHRDGKSIEAL